MRLTPQLTSLKTLNITYRTQETLLSTPETLPTSEPSTPQISYTVAQSDLSLSFQPYKKVYVACLIAAGKCPTAATIYWRMLKNGTSVNTGSGSVSAGYYYTRMFYFYDVTVGDVLGIKLWSNQTDSNWDYKAYQIQVTRIIPMKTRILVPCNFKAVDIQPTLTLGNPSGIAYYFHIYHTDREIYTATSPINYESLYPKDTYGLFRLHFGDYSSANSSSQQTSTTIRPYYFTNYVPTQIQMRGVKVD